MLPNEYDPKEGFLLTNRDTSHSGVLFCEAPDFPMTERIEFILDIISKLYKSYDVQCTESVLSFP